MFDSNKIYNNIVEGFLVMSLDTFQVVKGVDIEKYAKVQQTFTEENPCNIYFILKRARVTVDKKNVKINDNKVILPFLVHDKDEVHTLKMHMEFKNVQSGLIFHSEYPYNRFSITDGIIHIYGGCPAMILEQLEAEDPDDEIAQLLDYEVLYIGQAYGKNGERNALDRLVSHDTLQKIYSDCVALNPDSEIWIMLANFTQTSALIVNGLVKTEYIGFKDDDDKKSSHFFHNNGFKLKEKQELTLTEAALIKYFQPKYNIEYKDSFPNNRHKSYEESYNLDIRAIGIEVDISNIPRRLYSPLVERKDRHYMLFDLIKTDDRYSLSSLSQLDID